MVTIDIKLKPCPFCGAFLENEAPSTINLRQSIAYVEEVSE